MRGVVCGYIVADGGKIKRLFNKRAIISGGILLDENISTDALSKLLSIIIAQLRKKVIYIEIRNYNDYSLYQHTFEKSGFEYLRHVNYQINLAEKDAVAKRFSRSKRYQIKSSQQKGIYINETSELKDIHAFYTILEKLYKNKVRYPLFPVEFFEKLVKTSFGKLFVVKKDETIIGGIACAVFNNEVVYEWFVCGEDASYKEYYPSVMATWAGIKYGMNNDYKLFDFMGAGNPDKNYGVREFKSKFGGDLVEYGRFLHVCKPFWYKIGTVGIKILKTI